MTPSQFYDLKVGDRIEFRGKKRVITRVEHEYDYINHRPTNGAWQITTDHDETMRLSDPHINEVNVEQ